MIRPALKPCGTSAAYRRHIRNGEEACAACRKAHSDSIAPWRGNRTPPPPRELRTCPSEAAYHRHLRRQQRLRQIGDLAGAYRAQPCGPCRQAHAEYVAGHVKASRARKRAAA